MIKSNNIKPRDFKFDFKPRLFSEVVGRTEEVDRIAQWILTDSIPRGVLFAGGVGTGKTVLADLLARSAACCNRDANQYEPCNACSSCKGAPLMHMRKLIGSRTSPDQLRDMIFQIKNLGTGSSWGDAATMGRWYPILIDELEELPPQCHRDLRAALEGKWSNGFLVGTSANHQKIDYALKTRLSTIHLLPPSRDELVPWILKICQQTDIIVTDADNAHVLIDVSGGVFRLMLDLLQCLHDSGRKLDADDIKRAAVLMGWDI